MTLDPLKDGAVFDIEPAALGTGGILAEKEFQFGLRCNSDAVVSFVG